MGCISLVQSVNSILTVYLQLHVQYRFILHHNILWVYSRADSRLAPSQWETSLQRNSISHWLGANLESALYSITYSMTVIKVEHIDYTWILQMTTHSSPFHTLSPRQNGCHFLDNIFKYIFLTKNIWISIKISPQFVLKGPSNNIPSLVQITAWRWPGD